MTTIDQAGSSDQADTATSPIGFPQPPATLDVDVPRQRQPHGYPPPNHMPRPSVVSTAEPHVPTQHAAPRQSLLARHLSAIIIAAAIVLVGGAGIVAWSLEGDVASAPASSGATAASAPAAGESDGGGSTGYSSTATGMDYVYLTVLRNNGIAVNDEAGMIRAGQWVCGEVRKGQHAMTVGYRITSQTQMTPRQAGTVVGASIGAYCSEYNYQTRQGY